MIIEALRVIGQKILVSPILEGDKDGIVRTQMGVLIQISERDCIRGTVVKTYPKSGIKVGEVAIFGKECGKNIRIENRNFIWLFPDEIVGVYNDRNGK